jgi:amino acid adenylation domain-containing protein
MGQAGYTGACIPEEYGGKGWDVVTFGLLNEALGRADSALTSVLTVQAMVSMALLKWGTSDQRNVWLPLLARGEMIGAFALTEPGAGSDIESLVTQYRQDDDAGGFILNGEKKWITCGQIAGVFLVFGKVGGKPLACLVPRDSAGLEIEPIRDLMGFRAAGLARLRFNNVVVPLANAVGKPGFALSHVAAVGLQFGRISTACSALGLLRGCFEESTSYAASRRIREVCAGDLGMIQSLIAKMGADLEASRLLCWNACRAEDDHLPEAYEKAFIAKYFTSRAAVRAASDAVQIHGASGCHESSAVSRYYRGSKIMEIIEGTTQVHEAFLGKSFVQKAASTSRQHPGNAVASDPHVEFNRTHRDFPDKVTLHALIEARVAQNPRHPAVICDHDPFWGKATLDYGELNERANQLAHRLRECGVGPDHIIGLMVERSFAMMIGLLGILKAGGAYLPLSPDDPADRIRYVANNADIKIMLAQNATAAKAPPGVQILNLEERTLYEGPSHDPVPVNRPTDLAYVIYTSGSTGKPKGVMIEHCSVVNRLDWMQNAYPIDHRDVLLQKTSYCFDVSVWELFWWAIQGASLCMLMPRGERIPQAIVEAVEKHRVSMIHFVPSMLNVFLEYLDGKPKKVSSTLGSLRRCFASGEALSPAHVQKFNAVIASNTGTRLTNLYGPTETTVDVTYFDCPAQGSPHTIPIGKPIQNTQAYVLREGRPMPIGETGELCIGGTGLARGYLNNPELTKDRFVENPIRREDRIYRTGDLARWLPDGNLEYLGREDQQVKIRGLRIELGEIENTILGYPGIADCAVTTKKFSDSITLIVAYLVCEQELDVAALRQHLHRNLPEYMVPGHYQRLERIPLSSNGKCDRKALPEPLICAKDSPSNE